MATLYTSQTRPSKQSKVCGALTSYISLYRLANKADGHRSGSVWVCADDFETAFRSFGTDEDIIFC